MSDLLIVGVDRTLIGEAFEREAIGTAKRDFETSFTVDPDLCICFLRKKSDLIFYKFQSSFIKNKRNINIHLVMRMKYV